MSTVVEYNRENNNSAKILRYYQNNYQQQQHHHHHYKLEIKDFLDFLSAAYKVVKVLETDDNGNNHRRGHRQDMFDFNWDLILRNKLISSLFDSSSSSPFFDSLIHAINDRYFDNDNSRCSSNNNNYQNNKPETTIVRSKTENCIKFDKCRRTNDGEKNGGNNNFNEDDNDININNNNNNNNKCDQLQPFLNSKRNIDYARTVLIGKLNEILEEGILDSILTYLLPRNSVNISTSKIAAAVKQQNHHTDYGHGKYNNNNNNNNNNKKKELRRRKLDQNVAGGVMKSNLKIGDEVEIHVYDEVKGFKKDFKCSQNLLVSKMGYFSEVTKGQKLDEMDISVHCDITIFDWLMRWIKKDVHTIHNEPNLDSKNVIPIMVSANFLQMEPLFQECLNFCKVNINEVIKYSPNLSCLSDSILKRLADLLSNVEVQTLKDKKDKIRSRLFCKLIISLNETIPAKQTGHYASLAYLYFCLYCGKLVTKLAAPYVPCQLQYITITYRGDVTSNHFRDPRWNLSDHIRKLWIQYKNWGRTYWRLWSQCHFLYCYLCNTMYAVEFSDCCPYHPQQPHFYPMEQFQTTNSPIGRYPCCGSKAVRYETVLIPSGCKLRSHIPKLQYGDDTHVQNLITTFPELVKQSDLSIPMSTAFNYSGNEKDKKILSSNAFKESKCKELNAGQSESGLVCNVWRHTFSNKVTNYKALEICYKSSDINVQNAPEELDNDTEYLSIGESENSDSISVKESIMDASYSKDGIAQDGGLLRQFEIKPLWSSKYTIRHNQDNQRDYEELAFRAMSGMLFKNAAEQSVAPVVQTKRLKSVSGERQTNNFGGTYQQIEAEWREAHKLKTQITPNLSKK